MNRAQRRRAAKLSRKDSRRIAIDPYGLVQLVISGRPSVPQSTPWSRDDREWFAANPRRSHRVRLPFEGEQFDGASNVAPQFVVIRQLQPGRRARKPFTVVACADDTFDMARDLILRAFADEGAAHLLFDLPGGRLVLPGELAAMIASYETTRGTS